MSTRKASVGVQSVHRALDVLEVVTRSGPLGVTQIGQLVGLPPSTAHGLIHTLTMRNYLVRVRGGYALGPAAIGSGSWHDHAAKLVAHVDPILVSLSARAQLASTATVLVGREARIVASTPSPGVLGMRVEHDVWKDPLKLATGWVLVAFGDRKHWGDYIARTDLSPRLYPSWRQVFAQIREHGLALNPTRDPRSAVSIAMPVRARNGEVLCSLGLFTPAYLAADVMNPAALDMLYEACSEASQAFGGEVNRPAPPDFAALRRHLPDNLLHSDHLSRHRDSTDEGDLDEQ
ncbi:IclR family transcriptional regulator [Ruania alba]|uniref:IclR family transcriptional regulator n=1 Tax=Ruania alba TaxID=648782 RepID=UPI0015873B10|nr:helix-turn-helix domain-containing protein [Ruania alba]